MRWGLAVRHKLHSTCGHICSDPSTQFTTANIWQWSTGTAWHTGHLGKGNSWRWGGDPPERKRNTQTQQQLLHVLVDKYHRPILNPHQQHGSQRRSHRSLLVSDLLPQLDPPAMAYVPILQMTGRQPSVRFTLLLWTTMGFIKTCSHALWVYSSTPLWSLDTRPIRLTHASWTRRDYSANWCISFT